MDEEKKTQGEEIPGKAEAEGPAAEDRRTTDAPDVQTDAPPDGPDECCARKRE